MDDLVVLFIVLAAILWVWAVYDILKTGVRNRLSLSWLVIVIFCPIIGSIAYFQLKPRSRRS